jgi:uncharacterized Zn finger protein
MVRMTAAPGFTEADIERLAGSRSFERGTEYMDEVTDLEISESQVTATVYGTDRYRVTLSTGGGQLAGVCTCPHGLEGNFCKHCVATGLVVLELSDDLPEILQASQARETSLRSWLESLSHKELLTELLDVIADDPDLRRRFELRAAAEHGDAATIRRAVRELIQVTGYLEYDQAWDYAHRVGKAADAIGSLIEAGGAAQAIGITREAIALLTEAYESVDDSSGMIGDCAHQLLDMHLSACQGAPPDPISLASYLTGLVLNDGYGLAPDLAGYTDLLGDTGTAWMRQRITEAFGQHPHDYRARTLMEAIVKAEGNVDALISIYASDLDDRGTGHLRIIRELDEAGRHDEALSWAERGLREAGRPDNQLVDYLADRYAADDRGDKVLALRRSRFEAERILANYQSLRRAATESGTWSADRAKALAQLREDASSAPPQGYFSWAWAGPVLVDALIDDGDLDQAWTAVTTGAAKSTVTHAQRLRLADELAPTRPADALPVYLAAIEPLRSQTGDKTYQQMARLLVSARGCHETLGTTAAFRRYLTLLRMDQKRKRNLTKILDANGLRLPLHVAGAADEAGDERIGDVGYRVVRWAEGRLVQAHRVTLTDVLRPDEHHQPGVRLRVERKVIRTTGTQVRCQCGTEPAQQVASTDREPLIIDQHRLAHLERHRSLAPMGTCDRRRNLGNPVPQDLHIGRIQNAQGTHGMRTRGDNPRRRTGPELAH